MSFYSDTCNTCRPGPITNNPLNGLCEKACISVEKVFDSCMKQMQETDIAVTLTDLTPADPALPLTFVSATCVPEGVTITNLTVDRFEDRPCFARVTGDITIPVTVNYTDANGVAGTGTGSITVNQDVVLYVPQPSIVPYTIRAFATCLGVDGEYTGDNVFTIDACITTILKVVVNTDILVPTYGYCKVPPCQEFTQDVCTGFFDLPLYPATNPVVD